MNHSIKTVAVILNGPPESGKDTIAQLWVEQRFHLKLAGAYRAFVKNQFKDALYKHTARHFGVDLDAFTKAASCRETKDSHNFAGLGERTPREALIYVSEKLYKPRYGKEYFGHCEASRFEEQAHRAADNALMVVYPDGGFEEEVKVHPADAVIVVRLHREGKDFSKDSRDYIYLPDTEKRISFDYFLHDGRQEEDAAQLFIAVEQALMDLANGNQVQMEIRTKPHGIPVTRVHDKAQLPQYATLGAAAADVRGVRWADKLDGDNTVWFETRALINPGKSIVIDTGLQFGVPVGYELKAYSRSGHGITKGVRLSNAVGIIDSDYRGNVMVGLHNDSDTIFTVEMGERVAQVQIKPAPQYLFEEVQSLDETARGTGGFGSTGSK